jgi:hypothetical protein
LGDPGPRTFQDHPHWLIGQLIPEDLGRSRGENLDGRATSALLGCVDTARLLTRDHPGGVPVPPNVPIN